MTEIIQEQTEYASFEGTLKKVAFGQMIERGLKKFREGNAIFHFSRKQCLKS